METNAQPLGYYWGVRFYLIKKNAYHNYLSEMEAHQDSSKRVFHLEYMANFLYNQIKDIDYEAYIKMHEKDPYLYRHLQVVHINAPTNVKSLIEHLDRSAFKGRLEFLSESVKNFTQKEWDRQALYDLHKLYFSCLLNETGRNFWFLRDPCHLISREFLEYVEAFSERWANIFALESVKLKPIQLGHKIVKEEKEDEETEPDIDEFDINHYLMPETALKELQEKLIANPPKDKRLEEERTLMLDMIARCLSGECYLVMFKL